MRHEGLDPTALTRNPVLRNKMIEIGVKVEAAWSLLGWIKSRHSKNDRGHLFFFFLMMIL